MYERLLTYTLYAQNLTEGHRSFDGSLSIKDFTRNVYFKDLNNARTVKYVNPRGQTIILRDKNGVKK